MRKAASFVWGAEAINARSSGSTSDSEEEEEDSDSEFV
jgi:hypothetical protein